MNDDINRKAQKSEILNGGSVKKTLSNKIERQIKDGVNNRDLNKPNDNKTQAQKFKIHKIAEKKAKQKNNSTVPRDIRLMPKEKFSQGKEQLPKSDIIKNNQGSAQKGIKPSAQKLNYAEAKSKKSKVTKRNIKLVPKNKYKFSQGKELLSKSDIIKNNQGSAQKGIKPSAQKLNYAKAKSKKSKVTKQRNIKIARKGKYFVSTSGSKGVSPTNAKNIGGSPPPKAPNILKPAVNTVKSRTLQEDKDGNTGVEGVKLGLRSVDKAVNQARTIKNRLDSTVNTSRKINNRISRQVRSSVTKRKLKTSATASKRGIKTSANMAKTSAKTAAKASAKAAAKGAKAAKAAAQTAVKTSKATTAAVQKAVSLIVETAPWSLIIIAVIVVIIMVFYIINTVIGSAAGSVAGGGGWMINNNNNATEQDLHNNLNNLYTKAKDAFAAKVKTPLTSEIDNFYNASTSQPYHILECQNTLYYPAVNSTTALDNYFSSYDDEFYTNMVALMYILKRRSNANVTYNDISQSDFEVLLGDVDNNTCTYGQTFVYKTTTEVTNCKCPTEDCQFELRDDNCAYTIDEETGDRVEYCQGHSYCSGDHTKLQVNMYKVTDYTNKSLSEIYNFTSDESNLYNTIVTLLQNIL